MNSHDIELQGAALAASAALSPALGHGPQVSSPQDVAPATVARPRHQARGGVAVQASRIVKRYGHREVLTDVDLHMAPGEFVAVVGRSGCGKSTLLRLLAGLESADAGHVTLDGDTQSRHQGDVRIMFQDARLLPWRRVLDNVALGLQGPDVKERAREALAQVGLSDRAQEWPAVLSGGQRQRVALARALVHTPRLLLLDEPLGALDALTRIEMQRLIEDLWQRHGFTALLVTHDVSEAIALADRVVLIEDHRIALDEGVGAPGQGALARPRSRGAAAFAAIEERVLQRVLSQPGDPAQEPVPPPLAGSPAATCRWAV